MRLGMDVLREPIRADGGRHEKQNLGPLSRLELALLGPRPDIAKRGIEPEITGETMPNKFRAQGVHMPVQINRGPGIFPARGEVDVQKSKLRFDGLEEVRRR